jgi:hypothetical protein
MMEQTSGIRQDVKDFMRECERFFGFAHQSGGLTQEECEALSYYSAELSTHLSSFCSVHQQTEPHK